MTFCFSEFVHVVFPISPRGASLGAMVLAAAPLSQRSLPFWEGGNVDGGPKMRTRSTDWFNKVSNVNQLLDATTISGQAAKDTMSDFSAIYGNPPAIDGTTLILPEAHLSLILYGGWTCFGVRDLAKAGQYRRSLNDYYATYCDPIQVI